MDGKYQNAVTANKNKRQITACVGAARNFGAKGAKIERKRGKKKACFLFAPFALGPAEPDSAPPPCDKAACLLFLFAVYAYNR